MNMHELHAKNTSTTQFALSKKGPENSHYKLLLLLLLNQKIKCSRILN